MIYDSESNRIILPADELSEFAYQRDNTASLMQRYGFIDDSRNNHSGYLDSYQTSVELEKNIEIKDINLAVRALADIVSYNGDIHTVETVKTLNYLRRDITPFSHPEDFAKAVVSAYLFADTYNLPELNVKLTFQKQYSSIVSSFVPKRKLCSFSQSLNARAPMRLSESGALKTISLACWIAYALISSSVLPSAKLTRTRFKH